MSELGITEETTLSFKMGKDGAETLSVTIGPDESMSDLVSKLNSEATDSGLGLTANFDAKQGRLYIASEKTAGEVIS